MAKGYVIARVEVDDAEAYKKYAEGSLIAVQKFGGRFLARGGKTEVMEGEGMSRNVIIEFASLDIAREYYKSAEYQAAREHRLGKANFNLIIVEGV